MKSNLEAAFNRHMFSLDNLDGDAQLHVLESVATYCSILEHRDR